MADSVELGKNNTRPGSYEIEVTNENGEKETRWVSQEAANSLLETLYNEVLRQAAVDMYNAGCVACTASCRVSCAVNCFKACRSSCSDSCESECISNCYLTCSNDCNTSCKNHCTTSACDGTCTGTCENESATGCYQNDNDGDAARRAATRAYSTYSLLSLMWH